MPSQVVIENPIINSPFEEPRRHFRFDDEGITDTVVEARRTSSYFVPIAMPRKKGKKQKDLFETTWTLDRQEENKLINDIRARVALWRQGGYANVTRTTERLLSYWNSPDRERPLFFCQIEALETAVYLTEVASRVGDGWIVDALHAANESSNPLLYRLAFKMATGSGKTVVMAMLIAWQALNKVANPQDARFSDAFLIVAPGITIKDRLRVLFPNDPENYYAQRDLVPPAFLTDLERAKIVITNFHSFRHREKTDASRLTKQMLMARGADPSTFTETPAEMVRRVCRELGNKKNIVVLNDEAHHCYRRRPEPEDGEAVVLKGDERKEAENRNEEARIWISGLEAVKAKLGIKVVFDLSATPFFLRGSGYDEGTLFPWVVSDFSLIDAIESGIVKVPRVPVADNSMQGEQPTYRDLWLRIRDDLPKKGRKTEKSEGEPILPPELQAALHSLYSNYAKSFREWEADTTSQARGATPPVFIVVCNNTNVSKLVFDYIAGWEKQIPISARTKVPRETAVSQTESASPRGTGAPPVIPDATGADSPESVTVVQAGALDIFRNDDGRGGWLPRPNTILIDSTQLESGESMTAEFKKLASREIEEFKHELRLRFPGRSTDELSDEALLREVMNTVGKPGKLGEHVRCVVSVSMLTEGWDANTVTHILGVRAFGAPLLCEQVIGRGLRRMSYDATVREVPVKSAESGETSLVPIRCFEPEYAEVYGIPFSFIPVSGSAKGERREKPPTTRVRALPERQERCEITFPRVIGYRYKLNPMRLEARYSEESRLPLSTRDIPTRTELHPIVGQKSEHTLDDLRAERLQTVEFFLARLVLEKHITGYGSGDPMPFIFPRVLALARDWMRDYLVLKDNTFPQMLLIRTFLEDAADKIARALQSAAAAGEQSDQCSEFENQGSKLLPLLAPYDTTGSTRYLPDFDTTRSVFATAPDRCHVNYIVSDSDWEIKLAQALEEMPEVIRYVKNHNLGFTIPYTFNGREHPYYPDYIVHLDDGHGPEDPLRLVLEVTGERKKDKEAKVATARELWVPAINNARAYGRWAFYECLDPWNAKGELLLYFTGAQHTDFRASAHLTRHTRGS